MSHVWPTACPSSSDWLNWVQISPRMSTAAQWSKWVMFWSTASACLSNPDMTELGKEGTKNAPAACLAPTCARIARMSHVWAHNMPKQLRHYWTGCRKHQESLQLLAWHQQVSEWPTWVMFGTQHAHAAWTWLKHPECLQLLATSHIDTQKQRVRAFGHDFFSWLHF
jgi:hypothetical protein